MSESSKGYLYAVLAFLFWGAVAPIYFKEVSSVQPLEVLMHRILWSFAILLPLLFVSKKWQLFMATLKNIRQLKVLFLSTIFITINWLVFIWSVANDKIVEASLGYYINPLVSVFLGFIIFNERMNKKQYAAIFLALIAVVYQLYSLGNFPIVSFILAFSFGLYGMIRKRVNLGSIVGLSVETLLLLPFALGYAWYLFDSDTLAMFDSTYITIMLILGGAVTVTPLLLFNGAATRMRLSTLGFFQYIGPTLTFLVGIFIYNEPFGEEKFVTFVLIWIALLIFSLDAVVQKRK